MHQTYAVLILSNKLGTGEAELGEKLIKVHLEVLAQAEQLPSHLLFMNSAVQLLTEGSGCIEALQDMESKGVKLLACGTCINYYHIKSKIMVGEVSDMYQITAVMTETAKLITLS